MGWRPEIIMIQPWRLVFFFVQRAVIVEVTVRAFFSRRLKVIVTHKRYHFVELRSAYSNSVFGGRKCREEVANLKKH